MSHKKELKKKGHKNEENEEPLKINIEEPKKEKTEKKKGHKNEEPLKINIEEPKKEKTEKKKKHKHEESENIEKKTGVKEREYKEKMSKKEYEEELEKYNIELVKLQEWIKFKGLKVVVVFEGRDAAGKGGAIKSITQTLNPRSCRVVALSKPTEKELTQWYFQRYVAHLPTAGEMVLFDRSWYNRAGVEHVMGFCSESDYQEFLRSCPEFERMIIRSGIILIKYWFSVSDEEQEKRFQDRINDPTKQWKLSPMDVEARSKWVEYSKAKDQMFAYTDIKQAPWYVVDSTDKRRARLNLISHLLSLIPYEDIETPKIVLPDRQKDVGYVRPPMTDQTFVPKKY